jgi:uncharacterized protein
MKYLIGLVIAAGLLGYLVKGCEKKPADSSLPVVRMQIGGEGFNIEVATQFHDQEVGLMHRDHLDADHGMIFPMPLGVQTFWNHDVHFPLDVIFLDDKQDIVSIVRLEAYNDQAKSSGKPAEYAVELNAGTAQRLKLKVGDHLDVPKEAQFSASHFDKLSASHFDKLSASHFDKLSASHFDKLSASHFDKLSASQATRLN